MTIEAWHFLPQDRRLAHGDGRLIQLSVPLSVSLPLELCSHGLHASLRAIDALSYAESALVSRVVLDGEVVHGEDKLCAETRTPLWIADATMVLHEFACWCAEQALLAERAAGREPDARSWIAIAVKRRWIAKQATDVELSAARDAAWDAASSADWDAASSAARAAASSAASSAARAAAWDAAWAAARDAQNVELERLLMTLGGTA